MRFELQLLLFVIHYQVLVRSRTGYVLAGRRKSMLP